MLKARPQSISLVRCPFLSGIASRASALLEADRRVSRNHEHHYYYHTFSVTTTNSCNALELYDS